MECHAGQTDKAGAPYIFHPVRVACRCENDLERIVALLHDTVEDSDMTPERLLAEGFPRDIVEAVISVTHYEGRGKIFGLRTQMRSQLHRTQCEIT